MACLNGLAELICPEGSLILLDVSQWPDPEFAYAHALAHLDLGHHLTTGDAAEEDAADWLAHVRLDRAEVRATLS